jgi:hypothetical protein
MKLLKGLLGLLLLLGVLLVAGAMLLPATTHVERTIVIERPQAEVFAVLNSFQRFNQWSPWAEYDPDAVYTFEGPSHGVGARMSWVGNRSVGSGSQTIRESIPYSHIVVALEFNGDASTASYALAPDGEATRLTWSFESEHGFNPLSRWMGLLFEKMIGSDYEDGLAKLKSLLESESR